MAKAKVKVKAKAKIEDKDIRKETLELLEKAEECWGFVSINLLEIYESEVYKTWGFETFREYAEKELGMEYRIAMFRIQIAKTLRQFNLDPQVINKIGGWTKFKALLPIFTKKIDQEEISDILSQVANLSVRETQDFVEKRKKVKSGKEHIKTTMKFTLIDSQANVVREALNLAKDIIGTDNDGLALEIICIGWTATHNPESDRQLAMELRKELGLE